MFHLGWFLESGYGVQGWNRSWNQDAVGRIDQDWMMPELYIDMAKAMERAGFDYIMFEDSSMVPDTYGGTMEAYLRDANYAPKHDPIPLLSILAQHTSRLGLIATVATPFYPPYLAARLFATLDHISRGRIGINLVTSSNVRAAQNYGLDEHIEHDLRYAMADEWVELVDALWTSWEPDSVVMDRESGVFADHTKVHPVNFAGTYYRSRGPLNVAPSPQRRPVVCQAGGSAAGRDFAAKYADTIVSGVQGVEAMKAYRDDISRRLLERGRRPEDVKVLFLINPVLGPSDAEARLRRERIEASARVNWRQRLATLGSASGIDFAQFDPDRPLPEVSTNGHQSTLADFRTAAGGKTLKELAQTWNVLESMPLVGSYESVARQMGEAMDYVGGDGFLFSNVVDRRNIVEITEVLVPELQRQGLTRPQYRHPLFRDNLLDF